MPPAPRLFLALEPRTLLDGVGMLPEPLEELLFDRLGSVGHADPLPPHGENSMALLAAVQEHVPPGASLRHEILFVDPRVADYQTLLAEASPTLTVMVLDANRDGVMQITTALRGQSPFDAIHILSHGSTAQLLLGSAHLTQESLDGYREPLAAWGDALTDGGDILLYGCDVGAGERGMAFLERIAAISGADVAASTDLTGAWGRGGDWLLERHTGSIETLLPFATTAQADYPGLLATLLVTTAADETAATTVQATETADGLGLSLREAINVATAGDTIQFNTTAMGTSTLTLSNGQISITKNLTIDGGSSGVTLSGGGANQRAFQVSSGSAINLNLTALTIDNFDPTGGVTGGAISYSSVGGILTVQYTTVSNSSAGFGGGIYLGNGTLNLYDSTVNTNTGTSSGGGLYVNTTGSYAIDNTTITGNTAAAGGGIFDNSTSGTHTISNSTIASNTATGSGGGGLNHFNTGSLTATNTIFADNSGTNPDLYGTVTVNYSLIENTTGGTITGTSNVTGSDPVLSSLASNGGLTQTQKLGITSPALNKWSSGTVSSRSSYDQRGSSYARYANTYIDIGAYEDQAAVLGSATVALTESDAVLSTSGTLTITDVDSTPTFVAQSATAGSYGSFTISTAGAWSYTTSSAQNAFVSGTVYTDTFTVTSAYGPSSTVTINITGTNDAATLGSATVALTESDAVLSTSGTLTISDVDSAATFVAQTATAGSYGSFTIGTGGAWSYTTSSAQNAFASGTVYTDTFTVASADGTTSSVTINITGTNDAATVGSASVSLTETDATLTASGTLSVSDVDNSAAFVAQSNTSGSYGSFSLASSGAWSYTTGSPPNSLVSGTTYTDTFTVSSVDGTTSTVTLTITGTNDAATLGSATVALTESDAVLTTSGTLSISDEDSAATFVAQSATAGSYGTFTLASNGAWSYATSSAQNALVSGTVYTDTFTVASADGTTSSVTIRITGSDDAAVLDSTSVDLTESDAVLTTSGTLTITDVDSAAPSFVAQSATAGSYGSFTLASTGAWSYTTSSAQNALVGGTVYTDTFSVAGADGTTGSVTVRITGSDDAAVLDSASVALTEGDAVLTTAGTLTLTDVDSASPSFVAQSATAGSYGSLTLASDGTWSYVTGSALDALVGGTLYTDVFSVSSTDGATSSVTITLTGSDDAAVVGSATVALTEGDAVLTTSGTLTLTDVDSAAPAFVAQSATAGSYGTFTLASDGTWSYVTGSALDALVSGTSYTDIFSVSSTDGATSNVTVNITGTNDAAVLGSASLSLTEGDAVLTASGTLTIADVDSSATFVAQTATVGHYGSLSLATDGTWSYTTLSAQDAFVDGTLYTDSFTVSSADGTTSTITLQMTGSNDAAVLGSASVALTESDGVLTTSGTLTISDVDSSATFVAQTATVGHYGSLSLATDGAWSYTTLSALDALVAGTLYTDTFVVSSADGTTSTITLQITGSNDAAVLGSASVPLVEGDAVLTTSGTLTIADVDSPATFVTQAAAIGRYGTLTLATDGAWSYTTLSALDALVAGTLYTDAFAVSSADGTTSTITLQITGSNDAALLGSANVVLVEGDAVLTTSGTLTIADVDSPAIFVAHNGRAGLYGHFSMEADGSWSYATTSAHDDFVDGMVYTERFDVASADGTASSVTIQISGSNDAPTLTAFVSPLATTLEDTQTTLLWADLQGAGNPTDVDGQVVGFVVQTVSSGTLTIGSQAATATPWSAGSNDTVDATHTAYWTGAAHANGRLEAFMVVAKDEGGALSRVAVPVQMQVVAVNDLPTGQVTLSGVASQEQRLTVVNTLADVDGMGPFTYRWRAAGMPIEGATDDHYRLTEAEAGKRITVTVSYIDGYGTLESQSSPETGVVQPLFVPGASSSSSSSSSSSPSSSSGTGSGDVGSGSGHSGGGGMGAGGGTGAVPGANPVTPVATQNTNLLAEGVSPSNPFSDAGAPVTPPVNPPTVVAPGPTVPTATVIPPPPGSSGGATGETVGSGGVPTAGAGGLPTGGTPTTGTPPPAVVTPPAASHGGNTEIDPESGSPPATAGGGFADFFVDRDGNFFIKKQSLLPEMEGGGLRVVEGLVGSGPEGAVSMEVEGLAGTGGNEQGVAVEGFSGRSGAAVVVVEGFGDSSAWANREEAVQGFGDSGSVYKQEEEEEDLLIQAEPEAPQSDATGSARKNAAAQEEDAEQAWLSSDDEGERRQESDSDSHKRGKPRLTAQIRPFGSQGFHQVSMALLKRMVENRAQ
ncbi:MAG: DUF4347 domain-containing protein [Magnetococcales bacterium]|nr:DUF4347 domain-containing protein [Magnetococcales bacterium]